MTDQEYREHFARLYRIVVGAPDYAQGPQEVKLFSALWRDVCERALTNPTYCSGEWRTEDMRSYLLGVCERTLRVRRVGARMARFLGDKLGEVKP